MCMTLKLILNMFLAILAIDILYMCGCLRKSILQVILPSRFCVGTPFRIFLYVRNALAYGHLKQDRREQRLCNSATV